MLGFEPFDFGRLLCRANRTLTLLGVKQRLSEARRRTKKRKPQGASLKPGGQEGKACGLWMPQRRGTRTCAGPQDFLPPRLRPFGLTDERLDTRLDLLFVAEVDLKERSNFVAVRQLSPIQLSQGGIFAL